MACFMVSFLAFLKCSSYSQPSYFFLLSKYSLIELSKNCLNPGLWVSFPTYMLPCRSMALKLDCLLELLGEGLFGLHPWRCWCRSRAGHRNFAKSKFLIRDQRAMNEILRQTGEPVAQPHSQEPCSLTGLWACDWDRWHQGHGLNCLLRDWLSCSLGHAS